ncbi:MAG TPA: sigma-70 family RNA polymerase sigma factor [Verrucomicrobiota bacterium]|nr:RNA polymerase subunit sigma [Verrucomicrobiales bacterium]HRI13814.1 sigma-70 family RNA polymerase sigma factor [Verrucomicrobiota bacterium]
MSEVTQILERVRLGDAQAAEALLPLVYEDLRRLAAQKMAGEAPGQTLQPTALVHEAWLRLGADSQPPWQNRAHFFGAAAEAMRRILVENARRKSRLKRGGDQEKEPLDTEALEISQGAPTDELLAVHDALDELAAEDPMAAQVVKLRYFVGLPLSEVAEVLEISARTADRHWAYARARLKQVIRGDA